MIAKVENPQSAPRKKTGGRQLGTKNKATLARSGAAPPASIPAVAQARAREGTQFPAYKLAKVESLVPYEKNPRVHSPAQIDQLARLITEYGWTNPVLVDGKRGVIAGHGRVLAAKKLGLAEVPTIELSHLSAAQRRAYVIADNASALQSSWDNDLLTLELGELRDIGFDLSLTGFDGPELEALFDEPSEADAFEPKTETRSRCATCGAWRVTPNAARASLTSNDGAA